MNAMIGVLEALKQYWPPPQTIRREWFPENLASENRNAPPPYRSNEPWNSHRTQSRPSSCCPSPPITEPTRWTAIAGIDGINPGAEIAPCCAAEACTVVDVWLPESTRYVAEAPTINDPNAKVTLDISPPLEGSGGNCAVWIYHYGNPPDKPTQIEGPESSTRGQLVSLP